VSAAAHAAEVASDAAAIPPPAIAAAFSFHEPGPARPPSLATDAVKV
jgi:hypothetical protein